MPEGRLFGHCAAFQPIGAKRRDLLRSLSIHGHSIKQIASPRNPKFQKSLRASSSHFIRRRKSQQINALFQYFPGQFQLCNIALFLFLILFCQNPCLMIEAVKLV